MPQIEHPVSGFADNPAPSVETTFRTILRERMSGLPFLNLALEVEAVGFRRFQGNWLGVLITPWCMNYLILPGTGGAWQTLPEATRERWTFPAGDVVFVVAEEPGLGPYRQCGLFTSMHHCDTQQMAREAALAALDTLFAVTAPEPAPEVSTSKRNFLRGVFLRRGGDGTGR